MRCYLFGYSSASSGATTNGGAPELSCQRIIARTVPYA